MEQQNYASYVPSPYPNMMDLPVSHQPFRSASNGPTTPDSRQQPFDEGSYFGTVPLELLNIPVSRAAESSLDPWLLDIPGTASPDSSRLSMSPSQGVATPPSDSFYPPPYPDQLQLEAYQLLEQPQPVRSCSTSHPNWVNSAVNWQRAYPQSDIWATQPFVAQPWTSNSHESYVPSNMATVTSNNASTSNDAINPYSPYDYTTEAQIPQMQNFQTQTVADAILGDTNADEDLSEEDSDWSEEASNYSEETSLSKPKSKTRSPRPHIDRWTVPVNSVQRSDTRGYVCNEPHCDGSFVRPEHLRRHVKSKHIPHRDFPCAIPGCTTRFSRGDNLRDHYWTHLQRGGRAGKNKKYTLAQLREMLGPKEKKIIRKLRQKHRNHMDKERLKKQRASRPAYAQQSLF